MQQKKQLVNQPGKSPHKCWLLMITSLNLDFWWSYKPRFDYWKAKHSKGIKVSQVSGYIAVQAVIVQGFRALDHVFYMVVEFYVHHISLEIYVYHISIIYPLSPWIQYSCCFGGVSNVVLSVVQSPQMSREWLVYAQDTVKLLCRCCNMVPCLPSLRTIAINFI